MAATDAAEASGPSAVQLLHDPSSGTLSALLALDLRNAGLKTLPESIVHCVQLKRLEVGSNPLQELPSVLSSLPRLEILFASGANFHEVPDVLASCPALRMVSFNNNHLKTLNGNSLPEQLEWLIAANNQLEELPNIGRLKHIRKLMLSHNSLTCASLAPAADIQDLEMIRVAANRLEAFPVDLLRHPKLSWVAVGGNPFAEAAMEQRLEMTPASIDFSEVELGERLGSGAGATVYAGSWRGSSVAVKLWEGERFSDGTARGEWQANRVAGHPGHPALVNVLGTFEDPRPGMVLERIGGAVAASSPPSFSPFTVTRDLLPAQGGRGPVFTVHSAAKIARVVAEGCDYLHERGLLHGDVYLHNTLVVPDGQSDGQCSNISDVRLSDFGAAAAVDNPLFFKLEVRSFGWLLQDLLDLLPAPASEAEEATVGLIRLIRGRCSCEQPEDLPTFAEIVKSMTPVVEGPTPAL